MSFVKAFKPFFDVKIIRMANKWVSIDVGIKNLAYCVYDPIRDAIVDWNVVSIAPPAATKQNKTASLVSIGCNIKRVFDQLELASGCEGVLIENQLAPLNTNMKSIQCMIAQYFIMRDVDAIHFVSPTLKLKAFAQSKLAPTTYKQRKSLAVEACVRLLSDSKQDAWLAFLEQHTKKDDLCDSYLQARAFRNAVNLAENSSHSIVDCSRT